MYDEYWHFGYWETLGCEHWWLGDLCEIGMANPHNIAFGTINRDGWVDVWVV